MIYLYSVNKMVHVDYFYIKDMILCVTKHERVYAFTINTQDIIYPIPFDIGEIPIIKEKKYLGYNIKSHIDNAINIIFKCLLTEI